MFIIWFYGRDFQTQIRLILAFRQESFLWHTGEVGLLCEFELDLIDKHLYFIKNIQGDFGHLRQNDHIIHSKVAKIALNMFYKL